MADDETAARTRSRLRLLGFACRERLNLRDPVILAALAAPHPESARKFDRLAIKIAANMWGQLGAEWAASVLASPQGRKWADDLLLELLAQPIPHLAFDLAETS
jgi:hypothetical protein